MELLPHMVRREGGRMRRKHIFTHAWGLVSSAFLDSNLTVGTPSSCPHLIAPNVFTLGIWLSTSY